MCDHLNTLADDNNMPRSIDTEIAIGAAWVFLFRILSKSLGLISMVILARLLVPEDFGVVALATATLGALEVFAIFGFDAALIQKQHATDDHYDTAWTIGLAMYSSVALMIAAVSVPAAGFFDEPRLTLALLILALAPVFEGLQNIRVVDFRKKMEFRKDFLFMFTRQAVGFCVTIPLALMLRNFWPMIIGIVASKFTGMVFSYVAIPRRPRFCTSEWQEMFGFSKWMFIGNLLYFIRQRASNFIVGKITGTANLGLYTIGHELGNLPTTEIVAPINRAVYPGFSKVASDLRNLRRSYLNVLGIVSMVALPAGFGLAAIVEPAVIAILGEKWIDAAPIAGLLAFAGTAAIYETNSSITLMAIGRPDLMTRLLAVFAAILMILLFALTSSFGLIGAAYAALVAVVTMVPIYLATVAYKIELRPVPLLATLIRPVIAASAMYVVVRGYVSAHTVPESSIEAIRILLPSIALGAICYIVAMTILWLLSGRPVGAETIVWRKAVDIVKARFGRDTESPSRPHSTPSPDSDSSETKTSQ